MKVAIYSRGLDIEQENPLLILLEELGRYDTEILLFNTLMEQFHIPDHLTQKLISFSGSDDLDESINCLISLGGDGTMLDAVTLVKEKNIPLLGINFGRLGFLASISKEELAKVYSKKIQFNAEKHKFVLEQLQRYIKKIGRAHV